MLAWFWQGDRFRIVGLFLPKSRHERAGTLQPIVFLLLETWKIATDQIENPPSRFPR